MRALHPAAALDDQTGEHARLAENFQRDRRADDVHDRIHRADFVKMNLLGRFAVDFPLRRGDALKDGQRFFFHPRRKFARGNQLLDLREITVLAM